MLASIVAARLDQMRVAFAGNLAGFLMLLGVAIDCRVVCRPASCLDGEQRSDSSGQNKQQFRLVLIVIKFVDNDFCQKLAGSQDGARVSEFFMNSCELVRKSVANFGELQRIEL